MALISKAKGRREKDGESGYERLFGSHALGQLLSKCQAAVISTGSELHKILAKNLKNSEGISIANINKERRKFKNAKIDSSGKPHDIDIDVVIERNNKIMLIELKDGDTFDTKKVAGEVESLKLARDYLIRKGIPKNNISLHFCSFNAKSHEQIEKGTKGILEKGMAMTGKELCELLGLDFNKIVEERKKDQEENLRYFIDELRKMPEIKEKFKES